MLLKCDRRLLVSGVSLAATSLLIVAAMLPSRPLRAAEPQAQAERVRAILDRNCGGCHANSSPPKGIDTSKRASLISTGTVVPKATDKSKLIAVIESGYMPLGGKKLAADEIETLKAWITAGAPDWNVPKPAGAGGSAAPAVRKPISEKETLDAIVADLQAADERQRPYLRYYSIKNLYNNNGSEVSDTDLDLYRVVLSKLVNSLSWSPEIVVPKVIDRERTLLRIDLRDFDWTPEIWQHIIAAYPFGLKPRNLSGQVQQIEALSGAQLPYIRVDWFVANASRPPLYHDILQLPDTLQGLEQKLGVDAARDVEEEKVTRAGVRTGGVSRNNRVIERHRSLYGAYWKSFDFKGNSGEQNIFENPIDLHPAGGEFIFNLPNGLQAYMVANGQGKRLDDAPVEIVRDRTNGGDDPVVHNGLSCIGCHFQGMNTMRDEVRINLETQQKAEFDIEKALALYRPQADLDSQFAQDSERFQTALRKTGGALPGSPTSEPVYALAHRYQLDVSVEQAAADCDLDVKEFQRRVSKSSELEQLGLGQLTQTSGGVKRDLWEEHFGTLVEEIRLGGYLKPTQLQAGVLQSRDDRRTVLVGSFVGTDSELARKARQALTFWLSHSDDLKVVNGGSRADVTLTGLVRAANGSEVTIAVTVPGQGLSEEVTGAASDVHFLTQQLAERVHTALTGNHLTAATEQSVSSSIPTDPAQQIRFAIGNQGPIHIALSNDRGPGATYRFGETVQFRFKVDHDCFLTLYDIDTQGNVSLLFPNEFAQDNHVVAGQLYLLPDPKDNWEIKAQGVPGAETVVAIATAGQADLPGLSEFRQDPKSKSFGVVKKGAGSFTQDLKQSLPQGGGASSATLRLFTVK